MSIDPRQDPHGALDELVAEIEKTYELLGQEVAALRERAAHAAIKEICAGIDALAAEAGRKKLPKPEVTVNADVKAFVESHALAPLTAAM